MVVNSMGEDEGVLENHEADFGQILGISNAFLQKLRSK